MLAPAEPLPIDAAAAKLMSRIARGAAVVVGLGCLAVLFGYLLHVGALIDLRPDLRGMSPLTAFALLLLSAAAVLDGGRNAALSLWAGRLAILIGAVMLVVKALFGGDVLSPLIAGRLLLFNAERAGAVSAATAICLVLLGIAAVRRGRPRSSDIAALAALVLGGLAVLGYAYGVRDLYAIPFFRTMALHTAISVVALAVASLSLRPEIGLSAVVVSSGPGGAATRRLLVYLPVPAIVAWVLLLSTDSHRLGPAAAMAFLVVLTLLPLSLLILRDGRMIDALERERWIKAEVQRAGDKELRLIADAMPVLISFIDKTLTYRFANKTYEDWFYMSPDEVVGRKIHELLGEDRFADRRIYIEEAFAGREARFELSWPHRDGRPREADIRYLPRRATDGTIDGLYIFVADITDRKTLERNLLATNIILEERVAASTRERDQIWQASKDMLCISTMDGQFTSLNPAWTATLGWTADEMEAKPFMAFVHPDDADETRAAAYHLAFGEAQLSFENRCQHRDGSYRWLSWNAVPRDGMVYCTVRDITEAKEAATRQQALEEALRQSQKMEAVGQLTGGIAHDFNNLLTGITGSLDLLALRLAQGRTKEAERYIGAAQGAAKRAAALTHRLLAFSRRQTLDPKPTDANRLVSGLEDLIRRTAGPEITIEIVGAGGLWTILVDPNQLENSLLNLCINARDAMPDGGRITIETANRWLDDRTARARELSPGQYVSLSVTDTGTGMTREVIERVFDPFFTTKPLGQGTGLGLSMIYGFSRQSGGQVRIYSEVGQGTTMTLYLPRHLGAAEAEIAGHETTAPRAQHGETVLVVDDEATVRMLVTEVLEDLGYTAIEAADGAAGLKVLQSTVAIDLLVTDVGLPGGMNGRQVADAGRAVRPGLKVLFITGYAENAAIGNGHLDSGMRVLTKPFAMEALGSLIKEMIDRG